MVRISVLNDCLNAIVNAERRGKRQVLVRPSSKVVVKFLSVMQKHGMLLYACLSQVDHVGISYVKLARVYDVNDLIMLVGYIGDIDIVDDHRSGKVVIQLNGRINKCGVISPRFNVKLGEIEQWVNNLLPSRQFGYIVFTTSAGIMDHEEARRKRTGGKILGFFY
jgi:small subunit ribosomal protein S15Ae